MKRKVKLAFEELERELDVLSSFQIINVLGGTANYSIDCVIQSIAFATARSYEEVLSAYGQYYASQNGLSGISGSSGIGELEATSTGVDYSMAQGFLQSLGLNVSSGISGSANLSTYENMSVIFLDNGNGNGHAIVVTAHDGGSGFYYHDPQNGTNGVIANNDPRIVGFYN